MKKTNKEAHSLQEDRLKRQYKRLLLRWKTQSAEVSLPEIAEVLICTPRYARVLLNQMIERKWVTWASRPGRGAKGRLHCRVNDSVLDYRHQNEQAEPTMNQCHPPDKPGSDNRIVIRFYRPIEEITPSDHKGRVERHIILMVHAGLTRFNDLGIPEPDLAHTMESNIDHTIWRFYIRSGLIWHNGEHVRIEQLLQSFQRHLSRPAFQHVSPATLEGKNVIVMRLTRSDALLAYRLANAVHVLPHPGRAEIGLGAFSVTHHTDEHIFLNRFAGFHGVRPSVHEVEYRIIPGLPKYQWTTVTLTQSDDNVETADQIFKSNDSSGFVFLAFNERKGTVNKDQQAFIRSMISSTINSLSGLKEMQSIQSELKSSFQRSVIASDIKLPATLSLVYFWSPETELILKYLARQLSYWNCRLVLRPIDPNHWFLTTEWDRWDIGVSDLRFSKTSWFSPEERLRHSLMAQRFIPEPMLQQLIRILDRMGKNAGRYPLQSRKLMQFLIDKHVLMPLFSFKFKIKSTSRICGIDVSSQGWPDLTRLWIKDE